jgi:antitoxin (DNA-binding transcriptional repressor) of toxin-antitoxin stability system
MKTIMKRNRAIARAIPHPRYRNTVTTIMLILMTVLIVRDILVRRWASPPPTPDVTRRLP